MAARRKTKKPARRRTKKGLNVVNTAQSLIIMNATTKAFFGLDAIQFAGAGWLLPNTAGGTLANPMPGNSWGITAKELVSGFTGMGQGFGQSGSSGYTNDLAGLNKAIRGNLSRNGAQALATVVLVPVAFKVGKKLTSKPRRDANKLLKMAGLQSVVSV